MVDEEGGWFTVQLVGLDEAAVVEAAKDVCEDGPSLQIIAAVDSFPGVVRLAVAGEKLGSSRGEEGGAA